MTEKFSSYGDFLRRKDQTLNGVSPEFAQAHPNFAEENKSNEGCWDCSDCSDCSRCSGCSDLKNAKPVAQEEGKSWFNVPVIPNVHQTVLKAVEAPGALQMDAWHKCDTTHCRAGWVVHLAGDKGKALEAASSTLFAAMQIYKASSPINVSPVRFFEMNEVALADIKRCAELEKSQVVTNPTTP